MNFAPLTAAPAFVLVHAAAATIALVCSTMVMPLIKGTGLHIGLVRALAHCGWLHIGSLASAGTGIVMPRFDQMNHPFGFDPR